MIVEVKGVTKVIKGKKIIDNLSFSVKEGEIYGFLGPNGAGKTTTIKMMVGLMDITEGDISINGHSIKTERTKAIEHVGAIVENPEFYKHLSGMQNLIHFNRMNRHPVSEDRLIEVLKLVELEHAKDQKVRTYSLGMRQRLGIAQALIHRPKILILDEPTNGLDPAGIRQLRQYLRDLATKENLSVIVSSHLLTEIELMCDRVIIIQNGKYVDEKEITGVEKENEVVTVEFEVDQQKEALKIVEKQEGKEEGKHAVVCKAKKEEIPSLVKKMVEAKISIYGVKIKQSSLEETFLHLTEGGEK